MSKEKKGFWSKVFGPKKSSGCCSIKIEEERQDAAAEDETATKDKAATASESQSPGPASCCGWPKMPPRRGGGNCCG